MKKSGNLNTEIVGAILTIIAAIASGVANHFGIPFQVYLPILFGFGLTVAVSSMKTHILNYLNQRDRLFQLTNSIQYDDLRQKAKEYVEECELALEDLSKGIVRLRPHEVFKSITDKMNSTRSLVQASHLALESSFVYVWEDVEGVRNYLRANAEAIKNRNVRIERVFVLKREDILDSARKSVKDTRAVKIMKDQAAVGIDVTITWMESISELDTVQDFIIFDTKEVQVNYPMGVGRYYNMALKRETKDIRQYQNAYAALKAAGQPLSDFLDSLAENRSQPQLEASTASRTAINTTDD